MGFIYLIQLAKHKNINVYKVGMTEQLKLKDRLNGYGKLGIDYFVEYFMKVNGSKNIEEKILEIFNEHFLLYEGREWFMGNSNEMINIIKENRTKSEPHPNDIKCMKRVLSLKKYYENESDKVWGEKSYNWWEGNHYHKSFHEDFTEAVKEALDGYDFLVYTGEGDWALNTAALKYRLDGYDEIKEL